MNYTRDNMMSQQQQRQNPAKHDYSCAGLPTCILCSNQFLSFAQFSPHVIMIFSLIVIPVNIIIIII